MEPLSIAALLASLGMQAFGQSKSAGLQKEYDERLQGRMDATESEFSKNYNKDFFNTDVAKSTVKALQDRMKVESDKLKQTAVRTGATPESSIAAKGELQEGYGETMNKLLGYGTNYRDQLRQRRDYLMNNLFNLEGQNIQSKQQSWANFGGNTSDALGGLLQAFSGGAKDPSKLLENSGLNLVGSDLKKLQESIFGFGGGGIGGK
jgi:hypothetical protein